VQRKFPVLAEGRARIERELPDQMQGSEEKIGFQGIHKVQITCQNCSTKSPISRRRDLRNRQVEVADLPGLLGKTIDLAAAGLLNMITQPSENADGNGSDSPLQSPRISVLFPSYAFSILQRFVYIVNRKLLSGKP
jgi:hypothetical protein